MCIIIIARGNGRETGGIFAILLSKPSRELVETSNLRARDITVGLNKSGAEQIEWFPQIRQTR